MTGLCLVVLDNEAQLAEYILSFVVGFNEKDVVDGDVLRGSHKEAIVDVEHQHDLRVGGGDGVHDVKSRGDVDVGEDWG